MCQRHKTLLPGGRRTFNRDNLMMVDYESPGVGPCLQREADLQTGEEMQHKRCQRSKYRRRQRNH